MKQTSWIPEVIPLQHQQYCPVCEKHTAHATYNKHDNRTHLLCIYCGFTHIVTYGDEDDRDMSCPYPKYHGLHFKHDLPVCEL